MQSRSGLITIFSLFISVISLPASAQSFPAEPTSGIPSWLKAHVGEGDGQIAPVVLERARALYLRKVGEGAVRNPCYFAMDATRPHGSGDGGQGRRFYIICESKRSFRAISSGHGGGRTLQGMQDFRNGRRCAKHFSNALGSKLTAGGVYVTDETRTSFKGYYQASSGRKAPLVRPFIPFEGEGETANAEQRAIGGHPAVLIKGACLLRAPGSPYANAQGYAPLGNLVDYSGGRSSGCTSWSPRDTQEIVDMTENDPTTLYIYPEAADIEAVAQRVAAGRPLSRAGLYWNASCLKEIGAPKFWPKQQLEPVLARYKRNHPSSPRASLPMCKGQSWD
ncbi:MULTISPECIES: hypothetical protein [Thiorhodovibrio]|uniref:hypothetical protein n=1 Tax=Thiorhodovibrio TaxID=61593 RepID=UPI001914C36C|nr:MULTISPECIES: hypothetical protein [Thiorhodovibrio]MBK5969260.1 hypothetical protein [Thiorhodovibrio winogradskyi]WPL11251.1 hypothetical protein Thiosp_00983 [Thiorhodovibrio litoralis]